MFAFLDSFWKRTYKYYNFSGLFFVSLILALFVVILQQIMNSSFVTIVVLLSCILNSTKETDAYLNLNKFKSFYFTDEHVLKLSLFLYVKRNKFFWIGLLYSVFCLVNTSLFIENISVIMIGLCSLYSNLSLNKWSERIGEFHLVVLIILSTFHLGYYFSVAMNGLFCSALFILLIPENKGGIGKKKIRDRVISAKVPLLIRHLMLEQWQVNACLMFFFIVPKLFTLLHVKFLQTWAVTIKFTGIFILLIFFEILQDVNLENHHLEYNKLRFYKLSKINFFQRTFFSCYMSRGTFSVFLIIITNLDSFKTMLIHILLVLLFGLWYKFFEEKSLIDKRKPTWQLSYIRCWAPTSILFVVAFAPQFVQLIEKVRGY